VTFVATYWSVEVSSRRDIKHTTANSEIDGAAILTTEWEKSGWGESAEDDRWWCLGEGDGGFRAQLEVHYNNEEGGEDEVDG